LPRPHIRGFVAGNRGKESADAKIDKIDFRATSSLSSAFASCKSRLSNPSVNHL